VRLPIRTVVHRLSVHKGGASGERVASVFGAGAAAAQAVSAAAISSPLPKRSLGRFASALRQIASRPASSPGRNRDGGGAAVWTI